jgi:hypothetical protein
MRRDRDTSMHLEVIGTFLGACAVVVGALLVLWWAGIRLIGSYQPPAQAGIVGLRAMIDTTGLEGWG